jgi:hypothetical protein
MNIELIPRHQHCRAAGGHGRRVHVCKVC